MQKKRYLTKTRKMGDLLPLAKNSECFKILQYFFKIKSNSLSLLDRVEFIGRLQIALYAIAFQQFCQVITLYYVLKIILNFFIC